MSPENDKSAQQNSSESTSTERMEQDRTDPLVDSGGFREKRTVLRQSATARLELVELQAQDLTTSKFIRLVFPESSNITEVLPAVFSSLPEQATGFRDLLIDNTAALVVALEAPDTDLNAFAPSSELEDAFVRPLDLIEGLLSLSSMLEALQEMHGLAWENPQACHLALKRSDSTTPGGYRRWQFMFQGWDSLGLGAWEPAALVRLFLPAFTWLQTQSTTNGFAFGANQLEQLSARLRELADRPNLSAYQLQQVLSAMRTEFETAGATNVGRVREHNEDAWLLTRLNQASATGADFFLAAVADGMGGHLSGEVASSLALDLLRQQLMLALLAPRTSPVKPKMLSEQLKDLIPGIGRALTERAALEASLSGMGTTLCGFAQLRANSTTAPTNDHAEAGVVFSVGDSRVYLLGPCGINPLTRDHSYVQELIDEGLLSATEAFSHPQKNVITRCLGGNSANAEPDVYEFTPGPGEVLLIASDGLTDALRDKEVWQVVTNWDGASPQQLADALIDAANQAGGPDNVTAVVIACYLGPPGPSS